MEFNEKLQMLRKNKGITQEKLAEELYVSRTAVSKWESGRGFPNIESLKDISAFFSVSIDDLLSADKLANIAEKENKDNIRKLSGIMMGLVDLFFILLVILPVYPNRVDGFVYSVSLADYTQISSVNLIFYRIMFVSLCVLGLMKLILIKISRVKAGKIISEISVVLNIFTVLFLALSREAYAVVVAFLLLTVKAVFLFIAVKNR